MAVVAGGGCDGRSRVTTSSSLLLALVTDEVETPEVAEAFLINTLAPFIINSKLVPLMQAARGDGSGVAAAAAADARGRYIVNVSAMEGKFYRFKTPHHPHTNMCVGGAFEHATCVACVVGKWRVVVNVWRRCSPSVVMSSFVVCVFLLLFSSPEAGQRRP